MYNRFRQMETESKSKENPLIVDLKTPREQSTTKAWFSKVVYSALSCE